MMKKVLQGLLVMGAAAAISVGVTSYQADAKTITATGWTVDYANQKLTAAADGNAKIYVAKATISKDKKTDATVVKYAAATEYDVAANKEIDLSSFGTSKDFYLGVWGNVTTDPQLLKFEAAPKIKAVVDPVKLTVTIIDSATPKDAKPEDVEISGTEYATANGAAWTSYTNAAVGKTAATKASANAGKLDTYAQFGATLRFRTKAIASAKFTKTEQLGKDANDNAVLAYVANGFASNEIKAKIAKTANGPKATIDYAKKTIKIANADKAEYRIQTAGTAVKSYVKAETIMDAKKVAILDFATLKASDGKALTANKSVEVDLRTAATDKKPASKPTEYVFPAVGTITAQTTNSKGAATAIAISSDVAVSLVKDENVAVTATKTDAKGNVTITVTSNNTANKFEFVVGDAQTTNGKVVGLTSLELPTVNDKVNATLAAATVNKTTGDTVAKTVNIKAKTGQYIYVRKAANTTKGSEAWSTPYVFFGVAN